MSDTPFDAEANHICCYSRLNGWHSTLGDPVIGHGTCYAIAQKDGFRVFVLGNDEDARILSRMPFLAAKYSELERELAAAQTKLARIEAAGRGSLGKKGMRCNAPGLAAQKSERSVQGPPV